MNKHDKLELLDKQVLDLMLDWTKSEQTERLTELSVAVNYLKSNSIVEEKKKGSIEEDVKKRREEAKKRRESGESK